jgi:hypothetical protein
MSVAKKRRAKSLEGEGMKKMSLSMLFAGAFLLQSQAFAGEMFVIKSYEINSAKNISSFSVISKSPINCGGSMTDSVFLSLGNVSWVSQSDAPVDVMEAMRLIAKSEIISAAKNEFVIEIISVVKFVPFVNGSCNVEEYLIHIM